VLIHTAAVIHPRWSTRDFHRINVVGTRNVLEAAAAAGVRRAVVLSSNSPCGTNAERGACFDETSPYNPYMGYGASKRDMEEDALRRHVRGELETTIVRAPWFYGPLQPARQTLFFRMVRDGKAPIVGDGGNLRSMVYLANLVQGVLLAAHRSEAAGRVIWIADARPYTMNEIVDTIERLLEREFGQRCRHRRLRLPAAVGAFAFALDRSLQAVGLYQAKVHVLSEMDKNIACSIAWARQHLGYTPTVALEQGMRNSLIDLARRSGTLDLDVN